MTIQERYSSRLFVRPIVNLSISDRCIAFAEMPTSVVTPACQAPPDNPGKSHVSVPASENLILVLYRICAVG